MTKRDKDTNSMENVNPYHKTWLVYAKRQHCNHEQAIRELGFINWTQNRVNFSIGDVVYLFFNTNECGDVTKNGSVKFKAKVTARDFPRPKGDARYWEPGAAEETLTELTYVLTIEEEYTGKKLTESNLRRYGFPEKRIQVPVYTKTELIDFIKREFADNSRAFVRHTSSLL